MINTIGSIELKSPIKRRICFVISSLSAGGSERVLSHMANYWVAKDIEVIIITLSHIEEDFYVLDPRVRRVSIHAIRKSGSIWRGILNNLMRLRLLRNAIKEAAPDVVISFLASTNVLTIGATRALGVPIVVCERNNPVHFELGRVWNRLRIAAYSHAQAVVVQTDAVRKWAEQVVPAHSIWIIPNPVSPIAACSSPSSQLATPKKLILAMGRLVPVKGFDLLLRAFARSQARQHWTLAILGEGPEREWLDEIAREEGIQSSLLMPGLLREIDQVLKEAEIFVLSSRSEGFPNALLEAMACGVSVISFDCPNGPREILGHGERGILVENGDVAALSRAIDRLALNPEEREVFSCRAREVFDDYGIERIMGLWDETVTAVLRR